MTREKNRPMPEDELNLHRQSATSDEEATDTINIRVAQLGREVVEIAGPKSMTVAEALEKAGMTLAEGLELRVNNSTCDLDRRLNDGEIIMLVPKIVGGLITDTVILVTNVSGNVIDVMWFKSK